MSIPKIEGYDEAAGRRLRVLESVKGPGPVTKYVDQVVRYAPSDIEYSFFSWRTALLRRFDIFHVHFPEGLLRAGDQRKAMLKRILFSILLLRLRARRRVVVRTVHNVAPHELGSVKERKLLARLDALVTARVVLNECTPVEWTGPTVHIPLGDYREQMAEIPRGEFRTGRMLLFGRIRPYKRVLELIRALNDEAAEGLELRIVGSPTEELRCEIEAELAKSGRQGARVTTELRSVSDEEMVAEISEAELVLVPNRDLAMSNSAVMLMALSLNRPVAVRRVCLTEGLAKETGPGWVQFLDEELSAPGVKAALEQTRALRTGGSPSLVGRDWQSIGTAHADLFRQHAPHRRSPAGRTRGSSHPASEERA